MGSVRASEVGTRQLRLSLVTLGDPNQRTGGYRYHRLMVEAARDHRARIRFASVPNLALPMATALAARALRGAARDADAILLDSIAAASAAPWLAVTRTPLVALVHQPPGGPTPTTLRRALDALAYRSAAGVIVAAESLVGDLTRIGVPEDRIAVVPPGCDVPVASRPAPDLRGGRACTVLCVANWAAHKGILELLEAFATLPPEAATLWLVGSTDLDPTYAARVRERIAEPDLSTRVVVRGSVPVDEVGRLYRSADVFALSSFVDAYGTAWAEALAAGLPVVGWRAGNLPRLAEHGREALMAKPGDVDDLASNLRAITTDDRLRARLAAGARRRAGTLPTWDQTADRFFAAVRSFLPDPPP